MNFWLFTVVDAEIGGSMVEAADILDKRARRLYWLLNARSPNFRRLRMDDRVALYLGGRSGRKLAGTCSLSCEPQRLPPETKRFVVEDPEDKFNYYVNLKEVDLFKTPKPIQPLIPRLSFIKDKEAWWRSLQGSIIAIKESDYYAIVDAPVADPGGRRVRRPPS